MRKTGGGVTDKGAYWVGRQGELSKGGGECRKGGGAGLERDLGGWGGEPTERGEILQQHLEFDCMCWVLGVQR